MNPIKLVGADGNILGAIILPDGAFETLAVRKQFNIYPPMPVQTFGAKPEDTVMLKEIIIIPAPSRPDAVVIVVGTLYDFEKCHGCFFIPGYAFTMRGR